MSMNRVARLASRPVGMVVRDNFEFAEEAMPEPGEGEFRVKVEYISLDPAMRGWMAEGTLLCAAGRDRRHHAGLCGRHRRGLQQ